MARPVAYGQAFGPNITVRVPAGASQSFNADGGKFVFISSGVTYVPSAATVTDILGWADVGTFSSSSTSGQDVIAVNMSREAVYEMPINATQTISQLQVLVGKTCDWEIVSGKQYANYDSSTYDQLQIVGYKYYGSGSGEQSVLVRLTPSNPTLTGVA